MGSIELRVMVVVVGVGVGRIGGPHARACGALEDVDLWCERTVLAERLCGVPAGRKMRTGRMVVW